MRLYTTSILILSSFLYVRYLFITDWLSAIEPKIRYEQSNSKSEVLLSNSSKISPRKVPVHLSRFDYPWFTLSEPDKIDLKRSRGRILFSTLPLLFADGIGHACSSNNAELLTSWRLGITYSHRTGRYGSLSDPPKGLPQESRRPVLDYSYPASVEDCLGWGSHEIPREAVQRAICPQINNTLSENECILCFSKGHSRVSSKGVHNFRGKNTLRIDHVVEIPLNLSYNWIPGDTNLEAYKKQFLYINHLPFTAFLMPSEVCNTYPLYLGFTFSSYAFYFNKYWETHQFKGKEIRARKKEHRISSSFEAFHHRNTRSIVIPKASGRPKLERLKDSEISIAVHVRRGDFFIVDRPMVPIKSFSRVIRKLIAIIRNENDGVFSRMTISISFYSEGSSKVNSSRMTLERGPRQHDVARMSTDFFDADRSIISKDMLLESLFEEQNDDGGHFERGRVKIHLRISEPTVLCIHEMIAADIFIGSESGMSQQLVSSRSRGAMQILPRTKNEASDRQIEFLPSTGEVTPTEMSRMVALWKTFLRYNSGSAKAALRGDPM